MLYCTRIIRIDENKLKIENLLKGMINKVYIYFLFQSVSHLLLLINSSVNFLIYCAVATRFRPELVSAHVVFLFIFRWHVFIFRWHVFFLFICRWRVFFLFIFRWHMFFLFIFRRHVFFLFFFSRYVFFLPLYL